jgi:hypothetical protein
MRGGEHDEAIALLRDSVDKQRAFWNKDDSPPTQRAVMVQLVDTMWLLGQVYLDQGTAEDAERVLHEAWQLTRPHGKKTPHRVARAQSLWGLALVHQGRYEEAAPHLAEGHAVLKATSGDDDEWTKEAKAAVETLRERGMNLEAPSPAGSPQSASEATSPPETVDKAR